MGIAVQTHPRCPLAKGGCCRVQGLGAAGPPPTALLTWEHLGAAPASIPLPGNSQSEAAGPLPWQPPVAIAAADGGAGDADGGRGDSGGRRGGSAGPAGEMWGWMLRALQEADTRLVAPSLARASPPCSPRGELIPRNGAGCTPGGWPSSLPPPWDPLSLCPTPAEAIAPQDRRPHACCSSSSLPSAPSPDPCARLPASPSPAPKQASPRRYGIGQEDAQKPQHVPGSAPCP